MFVNQTQVGTDLSYLCCNVSHMRLALIMEDDKEEVVFVVEEEVQPISDQMQTWHKPGVLT